MDVSLGKEHSHGLVTVSVTMLGGGRSRIGPGVELRAYPKQQEIPDIMFLLTSVGTVDGRLSIGAVAKGFVDALKL